MRLTKHHALGNDFLVHRAGGPVPPTDVATWSRRAVALCHRRRGIGADGLIVAWSGGSEPAGEPGGDADATMLLLNRDGSRAEMSGNGIRCLAHALARAAGAATATYRIATDAGIRTVTVAPGPSDGGDDTVVASVDMGPVTDIEPAASWHAVGADPLRPVAHLSLGNPHVVVGVEDLAAVDLAAIGAQVPDVNLEIVAAGRSHDEVIMRVHERGAGITEACGTGACATAVAAARWGLAAPKDGELAVVMDGGTVRVRLGDTVTLIGPATFVADIEVPS